MFNRMLTAPYIAAIVLSSGCASGPPLAEPTPLTDRPGEFFVPCFPSPDDKDCKRRADRACPGGKNNYDFIQKSIGFRAGEQMESWTIRCHPAPPSNDDDF